MGLVDYGMGNLNSVSKALELAGARVDIVDRASSFRKCDGIVLPGVGAFAMAVRNLKEKSLAKRLIDWISSGRHFLGICLGYQLLFRESQEQLGGKEKGLGIFAGSVRRFPKQKTFKVPHMGWNQVALTKKSSGVFKGIRSGSYFYFVHSYYPDPEDRSIFASRTVYATDFVSSVESGNLFACQFHPEKSGRDGIKLLSNFVMMAGGDQC